VLVGWDAKLTPPGYDFIVKGVGAISTEGWRSLVKRIDWKGNPYRDPDAPKLDIERWDEGKQNTLLSVNGLTIHAVDQMEWDDPGLVALVVSDDGGCLRSVADSKVYLQSGPSRDAINKHQIESDDDSGGRDSPLPTVQAPVAEGKSSTQRTKGPLHAKAKAGVNTDNPRPSKRTRHDSTEDDSAPTRGQGFPPAKRRGDVMMAPHDRSVNTTRPNMVQHSQQARHPTIVHAQSTAHTVQSSRFPSHPPSQTTQMVTRVNSSRLRPQLGGPSQNRTQPSFRPSTSTFQPHERQKFASLPPVTKNGRQATSMVQRPREQHGAPVVRNNRYHELMMPLPNSDSVERRVAPVEYNDSTLATRPQGHFNNFSGLRQRHTNSDVNALQYHTAQTTRGTTGGAPTYHPQHNQYVAEADEDFAYGTPEEDFIDEDLVYVPDDYDAGDYGDNYY
jgi:hypothetical protein